MDTLLVLTGKTCSGKTAILSELARIRKATPVVTYTTRPMRKGEVDGRTYHFISREKFLDMIKKDKFVEYTSYHVASGEEWFYGTAKDSLDVHNPSIILNPKGVLAFIEKGIPMKLVYIRCSDDVIKDRLRKRGDSEEESKRRLEADGKDFKDMEFLADKEVWNENIPVSKAARLVLED